MFSHTTDGHEQPAPTTGAGFICLSYWNLATMQILLGSPFGSAAERSESFYNHDCRGQSYHNFAGAALAVTEREKHPLRPSLRTGAPLPKGEARGITTVRHIGICLSFGIIIGRIVSRNSKTNCRRSGIFSTFASIRERTTS